MGRGRARGVPPQCQRDRRASFALSHHARIACEGRGCLSRAVSLSSAVLSVRRRRSTLASRFSSQVLRGGCMYARAASDAWSHAHSHHTRAVSATAPHSRLPTLSARLTFQRSIEISSLTAHARHAHLHFLAWPWATPWPMPHAPWPTYESQISDYGGGWRSAAPQAAADGDCV